MSFKKIVFGGSYIFVFSLLASVISYLTKMVLARNLSLSEYGLFFSVFAFVSFFLQFRDWGLNPALVRYTALFNADNQFGKIKSAFVFSLSLQTVLSIIVCIFLFLFARFLSNSFFKDPLAEYLIYFFCAYVMISYWVTSLRAYFKGLQAYKIFGLSNFLRNSFIFLSTIIFLYFGLGVFSPAMGYVLGWFFVTIIFFILFFKKKNIFSYKLQSFKKVSKKMFSFGVFAFFTDFGGKMIEQIDTLMLTYFANLELVGMYNILIPTSMVMLVFVQTVSELVFPLASEAWAKKDTKTIIDWISTIFRYYFLFISPLFLLVAYYSKLLLSLLFDLHYAGSGIVLNVLLAGVFFLSLANLNNYVIAGMGLPKITTKAYFFAAIINLVLNLVLIPYFWMIGAAIATLLSYIFIFLFSSAFLSKKINLNLDYFFHFKHLLVLLFFYFFIDFFNQTFSMIFTELVSFFINSFLFLFTYVVVIGRLYWNDCVRLKKLFRINR